MSLIAFPTERASRQGGELTCECGSTWFELVRASSEGLLAGIVNVAADGRIVGYSGDFICSECGKHQ